MTRNNFNDVMERMKSVSGLKNGSRIARSLEITPQAMSNYKKRGIIPGSVLLKFAIKYNTSVDWLISGQGQTYTSGFSGIETPGNNQIRNTVIDASAYGALSNATNISPEELVSIGKLLKILRTGNKDAAMAIKNVLDTFLSAKGHCA